MTMNVKTLISAPFLVLLACSCASQPEVMPTNYKTCWFVYCSIEVKVVPNGSDWKLDLEKDGNVRVIWSNTRITWNLTTPTWEFRGQQSIHPHTGPPVGDKMTTAQGVWNRQMAVGQSSATQIWMTDLALDRKITLFYDIAVFPAQGNQNRPPPPVDPAIMNDL
jgi:hypothetical protein